MSRKSCLIRLFKTTVSCKLFTAIILSVFLVQPALTYAGVVIGGTRVVYLSNNPDKSISVFSKEEKIPYLIQAWVDPFNKEDKSKAPFTVIPPVSRLEPSQEKILRIIHTKGVSLPDDRESVFWLNIKNIPPSASNKATNSLEIAVKKAKVEGYTVVGYPDRKNVLQELLNSKPGNYIESRMLKSQLGDYYNGFSMLKNLEKADFMQARVPFELNIK